MSVFNTNQQYPVVEDQGFWDAEGNYQTVQGQYNNASLFNPHELNQANVNMLNYSQDSGLFYDQKDNVVLSHTSTLDASSPSTDRSPINATLLNGVQQGVKAENANDSSSVKTSKSSKSDKENDYVNRDDSELTEQELYMKRKAQNRAAQRAFRERKEHKLKDLETKLTESEEQRLRLLNEVEDLKQKNVTISTENQILKNTTSSSTVTSNSSRSTKFTFPSESQFVEGLGGDINQIVDPSELQHEGDPASRVLTVGAVWDYLMKRSESDGLDLDIVRIMNLLRGNEKCHENGPAYSLETVEDAIQKATLC